MSCPPQPRPFGRRKARISLVLIDREDGSLGSVCRRPSSYALRASEDNSPRRQAMRIGGARRDRTDDLMLAKHALYQLSYGPLGMRALN